MTITVFGLGFVGLTTSLGFAEYGHTVYGVEINPERLNTIRNGQLPFLEPVLDDALIRHLENRFFPIGIDRLAEAVAASDCIYYCVGTPYGKDGQADLTYLFSAIDQTLENGKWKTEEGKREMDFKVLVVKSTIPPSTTSQKIIPYLEGKGMKVGQDLGVANNPEFLREGTAVKDFEKPALVVVGTRDGLPPAPEMEPLFGLQPEVVKWNAAELVKYGCNTFHALKLTFANEIGRLSKVLGLDALSVLRILCRDTKLNISSAYMRPGNPFGGSCLPKDVRALTDCARRNGVSIPMIENLIPSNSQHLASLLKMVEASGCREVAILGLSFKHNTDDLRESPMVEVAQTLLGRGYHLRIFDPQLNLASLVGSNKRLIDVRMPHLASLLKPTLAEALGQRGMVIISQPCVPIEELKALVTAEHQVLDVNGWTELQTLPVKYLGFCWEI